MVFVEEQAVDPGQDVPSHPSGAGPAPLPLNSHELFAPQGLALSGMPGQPFPGMMAPMPMGPGLPYGSSFTAFPPGMLPHGMQAHPHPHPHPHAFNAPGPFGLGPVLDFSMLQQHQAQLQLNQLMHQQQAQHQLMQMQMLGAMGLLTPNNSGGGALPPSNAEMPPPSGPQPSAASIGNDGGARDPSSVLIAAAQLISGLMAGGGAGQHNELIQQALTSLAAASNSLETKKGASTAAAATVSQPAPRRTRTVSHDGKKTIGVTYNKANGWIAQRFINGKLRYLGLASNMHDACVMHDRKLIELMGAEEARKKGLNFDLIEGPKDPEVAGLLGLGGPDLPRAPRLSTTALPFAGAGQMLLNLGQGQGQGQGAESGGSGEASAAQKRLGGPISGREEGGESGEAVRQPPKKRRLTAVPSLGGALAATAAVLGMEGAGAGAVLPLFAPPPPKPLAPGPPLPAADVRCPLARLRDDPTALAAMPPPAPMGEGRGDEGAKKPTDPMLSMRMVKEVFWPPVQPDAAAKEGAAPAAAETLPPPSPPMDAPALPQEL